MAEKQKFYVVWKGNTPGVYLSWEECKLQTQGFSSAKYKSFSTLKEAQKAFQGNPMHYLGKDKKEKRQLTQEQIEAIGKPIGNSIAVDGAWNTKTGNAEYQGVYTETQTELFREGPFADGTNNIVEFLAIVHALAYCKKHRLEIPIYSDSKIAIGWVKKKQCRTNHIPSSKNKKLFELIHRAELWLQKNKYDNPVLKWETKAWGENPADFGRK